ncbi:MAG: sodium-dependent bicarbonate transport family permease [Bdellovibrionaceae bacterium]|nr:sodium-dependent bicarbonate transport family permease [Pseudobdellovibrionaceae bacterium]
MDVFKEPAILFFILGVLSVFLNTKLEIPNGLSRFLSLYLLLAIGFKGGLSLSKTGLEKEFLLCLAGGVGIAMLQSAVIARFLGRFLGRADAAAIAATYGSVSAVTFVAGTTFLEGKGIEYSGGMTAVLAMMEAPAIVVALYHYGKCSGSGRISRGLLHESFLNSSVYLLLGSLLIGIISGPFGKEGVGTLVFDLFRGLLSFFLMDLGIRAGNAIRRMELPLWLVGCGICFPIIGATLAIGYSFFAGISAPQAFLLACLCAGASYIAVPAALQMALPEARPGVYLTLALGVTFPFNILLGIPIYWKVISWIL